MSRLFLPSNYHRFFLRGFFLLGGLINTLSSTGFSSGFISAPPAPPSHQFLASRLVYALCLVLLCHSIHPSLSCSRVATTSCCSACFFLGLDRPLQSIAKAVFVLALYRYVTRLIVLLSHAPEYYLYFFSTMMSLSPSIVFSFFCCAVAPPIERSGAVASRSCLDDL
jgi:membrane-associated HD superfamily phosphohydrolase